MALRSRGASDRIDKHTWLFVLLLLVVLVPIGCVLWFMNEAVAAQSAAARQTVLEAYRGQLRLVRGRVDAHWRDVADDLRATGTPEARFATLIGTEAAEGIAILRPDGTLLYPQCCEFDTRVPAADRQLLDIQLLPPSDPRRAQRIEALAARLNDYAAPMPSAQRLFLMGELRALSANVKLPTEAALRLSTEIVEGGPPATAVDGFRQTALRDVWALTSADGEAIGFYRTGRLEAMLHDLLHQVAPEGIQFIAYPPGEPGDAEAIAAGAWLPGWQLTFVHQTPTPFDDDAGRRVTNYLWVGGAGIALMSALGLVAARAFGRQARLARLKTDLVASVSHELRTPLASMRLLVDGLLRDDAVLDPRKTREYLELISTENGRLSRLIENFLTFSRLERNRHRFAFAAVAPAEIVSAAVSAMQDRLYPGCAIDVTMPEALPAIHADADALVGALLNLLDNAYKYTPDEKRIRVRVSRDASEVVFAVEDNGIGIPLDEQKRIFRRFYRVDRRLSRDTSGVGLGLSIVEEVVRAHRGTVRVRARPGAAARSRAAACESAGGAGPARRLHVKARVLVIEDEPALAARVAGRLRRQRLSRCCRPPMDVPGSTLRSPVSRI